MLSRPEPAPILASARIDDPTAPAIPAPAPPTILDGALLDPRQLFAPDDRALWENNSRRMAFNARLTGDLILCRTLGRYTMVVDASDVGMAPHLIAEGFWEVWITRLIARAIRPGMVCFDAGANLGYYTVLMADLAGGDGRVFAAEPIPATRALLTRNIHHNGFAGRTEIIGAALGAAAGEVSLIMPAGEPKNAAIGMVHDDLVTQGLYQRHTAPLVSIDGMAIPRLDFIKIDVEGAEEAVWDGMQETIQRSDGIQIVMEVNCRRYADPEGFLAKIERRFPLRTIDGLGVGRAIDRAEVLGAWDDVMLYLTNP